ncbi:MAG TPA: aldo/keto reductase, partial [Woeseiaceae bacterium]|nr:aldo/keto reductase [Woeseiaceae bacterium]
MSRSPKVHRRQFLKLTAAAGVALSLPADGQATSPRMDRRKIPGTGDAIPVVGLGTSHEFDHIPADGGKELKAVLTTLVEHGGSLIDTAPRYGNAEEVIGGFLAEMDLVDTLFVSTKVSTRGERQGRQSLERSHRLLGKRPLDLMMVHSLVDAETNLRILGEWKDAGHVRYIGITTSERNAHGEMESLILSHDLDFVQVNYSPLEPEAAERVIPAAADRGVAVMINRAFGNGEYFSRLRGRELPGWAEEFGCESWAQFSLKYILGHPDVTCVLAATSS